MTTVERMNENLQYQYARLAISYNEVIHSLELNRVHQDKDELKKLMWEVCLNEMRQIRDSYAAQGRITIDPANFKQSSDSSNF